MDVAEYRRRQDAALRPLQRLLRAILHTLGVPVTEPRVADFAQQLYRPTQQARDLSYAITTNYMFSQALPSGITIPAPRPYPVEALSSHIGRITTDLRVDGEPITEATRADVHVIETARPAIAAPVLRQAQEPARETVAAVGEEHEHYGWARVLVGAQSCAWCAMLASRGAVYTSKQAALGRGGSPLNAFHGPYVNKNGKTVGGLCDCTAVLVRKGQSWEGQGAHERLNKLWKDTTAGVGYKDSLNAFRGEWDKQVRAGDTGRYLPESVKPATAAA